MNRKSKFSLIEIMAEVGIALELGGDPYRVLRLRKNALNPGSSLRRGIEAIMKENINYLRKATALLGEM